MLGRNLGKAFAATLVIAGALTGVQHSLCRVVSSDTRALYVWAEYKMLIGQRDSALNLLQEASCKKSSLGKTTESAEVRSQKCLAGPATMMF